MYVSISFSSPSWNKASYVDSSIRKVCVDAALKNIQNISVVILMGNNSLCTENHLLGCHSSQRAQYFWLVLLSFSLSRGSKPVPILPKPRYHCQLYYCHDRKVSEKSGVQYKKTFKGHLFAGN